MNEIIRFNLIMLVALAAGAPSGPARAQEAPAADAAPTENLAQAESRLAQRYARLELLAGRLAELSAGTQPRRAQVLRDLIARGRQRDVAGQFDRVIDALEQESYSSAIDSQMSLQGDLENLLELLLQEDRDRELASQRQRIARYLQELNRLIRLQRGVKARTDGGDDQSQLAQDQKRVGGQTKELGNKIKDAEGLGQSPQQGSQNQGGQSQGSPNQDGKSQDGQSPSGEGKGGEGNGGESGKPQDGGGQAQPPSSGSPSGSSGGSQSPPQPSESPMERAADRLQRAQQRMQQAQEALEESKRSGALQDQERAVEQLEQAKAELERILRQLREEELERMLVLLEARFRKMLDAQVEVYDQTKRLDAAAQNLPAHELEISSGRLSRKERLIVGEADRALVLLREDGTSRAFPEAVEQARDDMQSIADRLGQTKTSTMTQRLEEDVIAALEEMLAALAQQLEQLRQQQQSSQQGGEPGEEPLLDHLNEMRMIRALQVRVNRRTADYGAQIQGEQAKDADLLEGLEELSVRQEKIFRATRDLETENN